MVACFSSQKLSDVVGHLMVACFSSQKISDGAEHLTGVTMLE